MLSKAFKTFEHQAIAGLLLSMRRQTVFSACTQDYVNEDGVGNISAKLCRARCVEVAEVCLRSQLGDAKKTRGPAVAFRRALLHTSV